MNKIVSSVIFGLALISLVAPRQADATPTLELSDGVNPAITVTDQGAGDSSPFVGTVTYINTIGVWTFSFTTGTTAFGSPTSPNLFLTSSNVKSTGPGSLTIKFSETGFSILPVAWGAAIGGTQSLGEKVRYETYFDATNNIFGTTTLLTNSGDLVVPSFLDRQVSGPAGDSSFSLTQQVTLTSVVATTTHFDATLAPVPEPASLLLLGSGLIGLSGFGFWRRKNNQA